MHIPTCPSQALDILSFAQAQVPTNDDFDRDAWLYIPDHYAEYRYLLGTKGAFDRCAGGLGQHLEVRGAHRQGEWV